MKYYIYQNSILAFESDISESNDVANEIELQNDAYVELSDAQIEFYQTNPTANAMEVWNMKLGEQLEILPAKIREIQYMTNELIEWGGEMFSCDRFRAERISPYFFSQNPKYNEALSAWLAARETIKTMYPD